MDKNNKPNSYNFFKDKNKNTKNFDKKSFFNKSWKISKIFLYIFMISVALVGCVQTMAAPASSTIGVGPEIYSSPEEVSPKSNIITKNENGYALTSSQRVAINGKSAEDKQLIQKLITFSKENGGEYGAYNSKASLLILEKEDLQKQELFNNKLIFFINNFKNYTPATTWTDIPFSNVDPKAWPEILKDKNNAQNSTQLKDSIGKIAASPAIPEDTSEFNKILGAYYRDVIQVIYDKTLELDKYKDGKLSAAFDDVKAQGLNASEDNIKLFREYNSNMFNNLTATLHTKLDPKLKTYTFNYKETHPSEPLFGNVGIKPIITWADAWSWGPFFGLVVWPLAQIMSAIVSSLPNWDGWEAIIAILVAVVITRTLSIIFGFKMLFTQSVQEELATKKARIDAKYAPYKGNKAMEQRQRQEVSELYKKNNFNPVSQLGSMFITMPIFIAMWRIVQGLTVIKSTFWLNIGFSLSSTSELLSGQWQYLPLIAAAAIVQVLSQLLPRLLNNKKRKLMNEQELVQYKKTQKIQNFTLIIFFVMAVMLQAGIQVYWLFGGLWQICQVLVIWRYQKTDHFKNKLKPFLFKQRK